MENGMTDFDGRCIHCAGLGKQMIKRPFEQQIICLWCHGSGKQSDVESMHTPGYKPDTRWKK